MHDELKVSEIFYSIQGESRFAGQPCVFVRLAGCLLDCAWCDTRYARDADAPGVRAVTHAEVLAAVERAAPPACRLVELTGGEPLLQAGAVALLTALADAGRTVLLETSGAVDIAAVDARVVRIVDVKCPSSGMAERMLKENYRHLHARDELKFVVADRTDFDYALDVIRREGLADRCTLSFGPVAGRLAAAELSAWLLAELPVARLNLQLHRILWPEIERGV